MTLSDIHDFPKVTGDVKPNGNRSVGNCPSAWLVGPAEGKFHFVPVIPRVRRRNDGAKLIGVLLASDMTQRFLNVTFFRADLFVISVVLPTAPTTSPENRARGFYSRCRGYQD